MKENWNKLVSAYFGWNDKEKEPPAGGIKRVAYLFVNFQGKLFTINLLFLLCCIPVVTIPASIIALYRYVFLMYDRGYNITISDYTAEWKRSLLRRLPLGIFVGGISFYGYYLMSLSGNFTDHRARATFLGMGFAILAIGLCMGAYLFTMCAMVELSNRNLVKNAFLLLFIEWKTSLGILAVHVVLGAVLVAFLPYSLYLLLIEFFAVQQLCTCAFTGPAIRRRIVDPYERQCS